MNSSISPSLDAVLPPIDLHAHVDPTATRTQLATLGPSIVFSVTRTLDEASRVVHRSDERVLWGVGVHPGRRDALDEFSQQRFTELAAHLDFVGEIGLDRRQNHLRELKALRAGVAAAQLHGRLCSVHSAGRQREVVEAVGDNGRGVILHWFTGTERLVELATEAGVYFSINAAMSDEQITALPVERLLPETDYPFTRRAGSKLPGDVNALEVRCTSLLGLSRDEVRQLWYRNLRSAILESCGSLSAAPEVLHRPLLAVPT